jgi:hypothetical protein
VALPDESLGMAAGLGVATVVEGVMTVTEGVTTGAVVSGEVVAAGALGLMVVDGVGVAASAVTWEAPKEVKARANVTPRATVAAGYATTARR